MLWWTRHDDELPELTEDSDSSDDESTSSRSRSSSQGVPAPPGTRSTTHSILTNSRDVQASLGLLQQTPLLGWLPTDFVVCDAQQRRHYSDWSVHSLMLSLHGLRAKSLRRLPSTVLFLERIVTAACGRTMITCDAGRNTVLI